MRIGHRGRWRSLPKKPPKDVPKAAPGADSIVVNDRVLSPGAPITNTYLLLSGIAAATVVLFGVRWITLPRIADHPFLYFLASGVAAYYVAVWAARWAALSRMRRPRPLAPEAGLRVAAATTFVPGTEPLWMLEETVQALVAMDYPHETWVLDEGDDPEVRGLCERLGARHFSRRDKPQYQDSSGVFQSHTKYGNYNAWLTEVVKDNYDIVVTFDPDHVPRREYLTELLGYFRDPGVGYVQAPPVYFNQDASFIARGAAEETYAYHSSHQMASYALGHPIIVGSHSLHRVAALQQVGGFPAHHAEDLYLTMLYRAEGWRGVYLPRIVALGVTPVNWPSYLGQQVRWGRAVIDLKLRAFRELAPRLSTLERMLNLFHGVYFLRPVALMVLFGMLVAMLLTEAVPSFLDRGPLLAGLGLVVTLHLVDRFRQRFFFDPKREQGFHWRAILLQVAKWPHLVSGLFDAAFNRKVAYVVTPKNPGPSRAPRVLTPPHTAIIVVIGLAAGIGFSRHGTISPVLAAMAGLAIFASLVLMWTESLDYPPPFDLALLRRRQSEVDELLRETPSRDQAGVERRRAERRAQTAESAFSGHDRRRGDRRRAALLQSLFGQEDLITTDP